MLTIRVASDIANYCLNSYWTWEWRKADKAAHFSLLFTSVLIAAPAVPSYISLVDAAKRQYHLIREHKYKL